MALRLEYGFNESSGTTFAEENSGVSGTVQTSGSFTTGRTSAGNAITTTATAAAGLVVGEPLLNTGSWTGFTVMAWIRVGTNSGDAVVGNPNAGDWGIGLPSTTQVSCWITTTAGTSVPVAAYTHGLSNGTWMHVAMTWTPNTVTLWVNGVSRGTATTTGATIQYDLTTGRGGLNIGGVTAWGNSPRTPIDDVRIFDTALNSTDINTWMNTIVGGAVPAIGLRAAGTSTAVAATATTLNPAVPAGATTGDLSVLWVESKPYNTVITTPSGWTKIGEATNGTTAAGTDTGSMLIACYVRESATPGAIGAMTLTSANSACAVIHTYQKTDGYSWDVSVSTSGGDTTQGTNYSATGAAGLDVITGDWVACGTAVNSDLGTTAVSAQAIGGMSGATLSGAVRTAGTADGQGLVTTGNDSRLIVVDTAVTAGSSNSAPTMAYTLAQTQSGTSFWLRLRQTVTATPALPWRQRRTAIRRAANW